jgi:3-hydroxyisobutyrate dehydrogenase
MSDLANYRLGWVGTGVMGEPMCGHLLAAGATVTVSNRTREKAEPLLRAGARWAASPRQAADGADVIFTMVGFPRDVREVYFNRDEILDGTREGAVLVDMTTTEPALAIEIAAAAAAKGASALDAPVSGGDVGARNATLSIMVGGDDRTLDRVRPLLAKLGKTIVHEGGPGAGQHTKMCNQIVIAGTMIGVCESLVYGYRAGLNLDAMVDTIRRGAASCWALDNLAPRILKRDFAPGFMIDHFIKDMGIALEEAARMRIALPGLALVRQLYVATAAHGHGRSGTHALFLALDRMSKPSVPEVRKVPEVP